jgi:hypothetical protein
MYRPNGKIKNAYRIFMRDGYLYGTITPKYTFGAQIFSMEREWGFSGTFPVMGFEPTRIAIREVLCKFVSTLN